MFCRSWRPVKVDKPSEHRTHLPKQCRECWEPCWNRVPKGQERCDECQRALQTHQNPGVRVLVLKEPFVDLSTIEMMAGDLNALVATEARTQLVVRGIDVDQEDFQ